MRNLQTWEECSLHEVPTGHPLPLLVTLGKNNGRQLGWFLLCVHLRKADVEKGGMTCPTVTSRDVQSWTLVPSSSTHIIFFIQHYFSLLSCCSSHISQYYLLWFCIQQVLNKSSWGGISHHTLLHIHHFIHRIPDTGHKHTTVELEDMGHLLPEEERIGISFPKRLRKENRARMQSWRKPPVPFSYPHSSDIRSLSWDLHASNIQCPRACERSRSQSLWEKYFLQPAQDLLGQRTHNQQRSSGSSCAYSSLQAALDLEQRARTVLPLAFLKSDTILFWGDTGFVWASSRGNARQSQSWKLLK